MKAIRIHNYGDSNVLQLDEIAAPNIKEDEVLIQTHAAGVNPVDWKVREGIYKDLFQHSLPLILGWDVSGVISKVGVNVNRFKVGDEVFAFTSLFREGNYAEFIVAKDNEVALKPRNIDFVKAAGIPLAALTAWQALFDRGDVQAGHRVLVHAAAGGVGHLAVQLAKWKGAHVTGTASNINHAFLSELGVDEVIDYKNPQWQKHANSFDMIFDTVGTPAQELSWSLLKATGILISVVQPDGIPEAVAKYKRRGEFMLVAPNSQQLQCIAELIEQEKIKPHISKVLSFNDVVEAHSLSQEGHARGKMVLKLIAN